MRIRFLVSVALTVYRPLVVKELDLQRPIYAQTAAYGHFGNPNYPWEKPKQLKF